MVALGRFYMTIVILFLYNSNILGVKDDTVDFKPAIWEKGRAKKGKTFLVE